MALFLDLFEIKQRTEDSAFTQFCCPLGRYLSDLQQGSAAAAHGTSAATPAGAPAPAPTPIPAPAVLAATPAPVQPAPAAQVCTLRLPCVQVCACVHVPCASADQKCASADQNGRRCLWNPNMSVAGATATAVLRWIRCCQVLPLLLVLL